MSVKKLYAQVGLGVRSLMFIEAMTGDFKDHCELVAFCDTNKKRMDFCNSWINKNGSEPVKKYSSDQFEQMIAEKKPDVVVVTTGPDVTHSDFICRAMRLGCDVISEKPMTTDENRCKEILETIKQTGRTLRITFNYRYSPPRSQVKELLMPVGLVAI